MARAARGGCSSSRPVVGTAVPIAIAATTATATACPATVTMAAASARLVGVACRQMSGRAPRVAAGVASSAALQTAPSRWSGAPAERSPVSLLAASCAQRPVTTATAGMATRSVAAPVEATPGEVAVNDANVIFTTVWDALVEELGAEPKLSIPGELIFLVGAPGAGKGTNTQFVMETRGITAPPIGVSMTGRSMRV